MNGHDTTPALASGEGVKLGHPGVLVLQADELETVRLPAPSGGHADGHTETLIETLLVIYRMKKT